MQRVGVMGLGLMGSAFAANLLSRGFEVHVYNRTRRKADPLVAKGAVLHEDPRSLAMRVDVTITSLTDQKAVEEVAMGEHGFLSVMRKGALWVDMSTIDPDASVRHAADASRIGVERLDAPVIGGPGLAIKGKILLLVGGLGETYDKHRQFLSQLGEPVLYLGPDGSGHRMKLAMNLYLGLAASSFSEALVFAQKMGFEPETFVNTFNMTAHRSHYSETKGPKIAEGDFEPTFTLGNLLKDLRLTDAKARKAKMDLPLAAAALEEYEAAAKRGNGGKDYSAIVLETQRLNGLKQGKG